MTYKGWYDIKPNQQPNEYPGYDTKPSDGEASVLGNVEYPLLPLLHVSLWPGVVGSIC